ncbi:MAG: hypothetical protein AVDCRST_MAG10-1955 [uncultured Acidimicrobiales bacterium]|uniref:YndJ-like protein n=1 Tax=uncultured Acidimicrobiales bacterium TaxID=310071 RepID=A0A6J4IAT8_9ACTN|nr:MAG: hypothetical protein AVDCRST_MAG10-1955 [uncultured Acidimicrobiales bacterium]
MARAYGPDVLGGRPHVVIGTVVWLITAVVTSSGGVDLSLIDVLLLLAPLVLVPIGLVVAGRTGSDRVEFLRLGAAALLVPALLAEPGGPAGVLALPWLAVAVVLAVTAALGWMARPDFRPAALARLASPVYLTVGAAWVVASRLELRPVGIGEPIVELTAVHFHFAGFVAALLAARTCEAATRRAPRWAAAGTILTIASPPIVAMGFTTGSAVFQIGGALLLSLGVWIIAGLTFAVVVPITPDAPARALLSLSALAVVVPMVLAVFWAAAQHVDVPALDIPAMARIHGTLNAFGFSLAGLLGWAAHDADVARRT